MLLWSGIALATAAELPARAAAEPPARAAAEPPARAASEPPGQSASAAPTLELPAAPAAYRPEEQWPRLGHLASYGAVAGAGVFAAGGVAYVSAQCGTCVAPRPGESWGEALMVTGAVGVVVASPLVLAGPVARSGWLKRAGVAVDARPGSASTLFGMAAFVAGGAAVMEPDSASVAGPIAGGTLLTAWVLAGVQAGLNDRAEEGAVRVGARRPRLDVTLAPTLNGMGVAGTF